MRTQLRGIGQTVLLVLHVSAAAFASKDRKEEKQLYHSSCQLKEIVLRNRVGPATERVEASKARYTCALFCCLM